jgi:CRISPR-associated protein Csx10
MRTSVEGRNGSARAASLHSQQELAGGQSFEGLIRAADKGDIEALISVVGKKAVVFGGRRRAGKINLFFGSVDQIPEAPNPFGIADRPDQRFVALTLVSDAILVDRLLRPVVALDSHQVSQLLRPPADVELRAAFAGERRVAGWHSVGQLFKQDDIAISSGSTFLLAFKPENEETLTEWMVNLSRNGIGLRRSEGFGRVTFSALLHRTASTRESGAML